MAVISVSQLNRYVASVLDSDKNLTDVQVSGEISSLKKYPSGHIYFNLKDNDCSVSCVMFKSRAVVSGNNAKEGMKVFVRARASLYDRDGKFQLYVDEIIPDGIGDLFTAYEYLKKKLESEGLFDVNNKKKIPYIPKRIGVASSPSGAVIRDIINVLSRRFPGFDLQLIPVKVQGEGAPESIIRALGIFNSRHEVDVIIIARGGGSMEDLWCFNDEGLARAVASSDIPVISAVGHETDFTICDFASDLRAPTPSAAAELAVPDLSEVISKLVSRRKTLFNALSRKIEYSRMRLANVLARSVFSKPEVIWTEHRERVIKCSEDIELIITRMINDSKRKLALSAASLDTLSPLKVLSRGYSVVYNTDSNKRVMSTSDVSPGDKLNILVSDGTIQSRTE